jgi:DNA helicase-2/ATP-dependent DNA helicase PcrA
MSDVAETNEVRVFGPPGTGKTTWMAAAVRATAKARRTSALVIGSFTRAAATEIAGRGLPVEPSQVGTLHALAFRAIERPAVADGEAVAQWNRQHPHLALSSGFVGLDESPDTQRGATDGDRIFSQLEMLRARQVPFEAWPNMSVKRFYTEWVNWKRETEVIDFTDMIELALMNTEEAPGSPVVGFFDEVQDFTPLELALVRHWGKRMERLVLAGDDDQSIYSFKGASPDAFLDPPIPEDQKRVLHQSFRVPAAVHAAAQSWVEQLTRREPKDYEPRGAEGCVRVGELRADQPSEVISDVVRRLDERVVDEVTGESRPRTVMLLASCSYMLDRVKHQLRAEGVPFHNPYRRRRGDWNPLHASRGTSSAQKLSAYLAIDDRIWGDQARLWTGDDVRAWASAVKKQGVFRRGAAAAISALPPREISYEELIALFDCPRDVYEQVLDPSMQWYAQNLLASARGPMEYPLAVARRNPKLLNEEPQVILGTIHSVKGGQADSVYLFPDLSIAGMRQWSEPGEGRDSIIRLMYVGMTRAREELVLCQPSSPAAVEPYEMTRTHR